MSDSPIQDDMVRMEMLLDDKTLKLFPLEEGADSGRDFSHLDPANYTDSEGANYIPFKFPHPDHAVAFQYYKRARLTGKVGDPVSMLVLVMQKDAFLEAVFAGTVKVFADRKSIGFMCTLNSKNYPSIQRGDLKMTIHDLAL
jgi:hypothetical protein